ncbi:DUF5018 domain-containing protein [Treponema sp. R80B11-R83G3]
MKNVFKGLTIVAFVMVFGFSMAACSDGGSNPGTQSSEKAITAFIFTSPAVAGTINETAKTISVTVPYGTAVTALTPTITHTGKSYSPTGAQDFTNPVTYNVTAHDNTTQSYTVTVTVASANAAKAINTFTFASPAATGIINEAAKTIGVTVPYGTAVNALTPTVVHTGASYSPTGAQDFTNPVTYTVTAEDGTTQPYTVTVTVASASAKAITSFIFTSPEATGVINEPEKEISVTVPSGTIVTALTPTVVHTGKSYSPTGAQDFTNPVIYTVTAHDDSIQNYTVTVTVVSNDAPIAVTLNSVTQNGSATQRTTQLTLNFSQAISGLSADDITLSGVTVTKGTLIGSGPSYILPISGFTAGGDLNVAVAKQGYVMSGSPKTVTIIYVPVAWTAVSGFYGGSGIAWGGTAGNEKFVAVGNNGTAAYSADGVTWEAVVDTKFNTANINGIAWGGTAGNEKFVAVGEYGIVAYSADGVSWEAADDTTFYPPPPVEDGGVVHISHINGIAWGGTAGNEKFVVVGYDSADYIGKMAYSSDGVTWTAVSDTTFGAKPFIYSIAWGGTAGNEKFVAVGNNGEAAYSSDGVNWTAVEDTKCDTIYSIDWGGTAGNEKFVVVGYSIEGGGGTAAYSADGVTWTVADTKFGTSYVSYGIAWGGTAGNKKFVGVGVGVASNSYGGYSYSGKAVYSADGVSWTAVADTTFDTSVIRDIAWGGTAGNEKFVAVGDGKAAYWDGK